MYKSEQRAFFELFNSIFWKKYGKVLRDFLFTRMILLKFYVQVTCFPYITEKRVDYIILPVKLFLIIKPTNEK